MTRIWPPTSSPSASLWPKIGDGEEACSVVAISNQSPFSPSRRRHPTQPLAARRPSSPLAAGEPSPDERGGVVPSTRPEPWRRVWLARRRTRAAMRGRARWPASRARQRERGAAAVPTKRTRRSSSGPSSRLIPSPVPSPSRRPSSRPSPAAPCGWRSQAAPCGAVVRRALYAGEGPASFPASSRRPLRSSRPAACRVLAVSVVLAGNKPAPPISEKPD